MYGGRYQHPFAVLVRALEDHMVHAVAFAFVQQIVFPAGRFQRKGVRRGHLMDGLGVPSRRIDHIAGRKAAVWRGQLPAAVNLFNVGYRSAAVQLYPVAHRHLRHDQRKLPRADDGCAGGKQRPGHCGGKLRLHRHGFLRRQQPDARHAVCHAVRVQLLQVGQLCLAQRQHQAAALTIGHIQPGADFLCQRHALHIQAGHLGARFRVIPGVQDGAVCLRCSIRHIVFCFQHCHMQRIVRQFIRCSCTNHTTANDCYIQHNYLPVVLVIQDAKIHPVTMVSIGLIIALNAQKIKFKLIYFAHFVTIV